MKTIELIVPCYNEEKCIELFYEAVKEVFRKQLFGFGFIITFVDDGSRDNTLNEMKRVAAVADAGRVQYIALSRNFGKESAIYAGLSKCTGDYVALLDADLQHPPELLVKMVDAIENEGYDRATARRVSRKGEPVIRSAFSKAFYHIINRVTVLDLVSGSTDYCLMKKNVADSIVSMCERERFTKGIYSWVGFKNKWVEYENVERVAGHTKWSFIGLARYAYNGFIAFATTPLRGVVYLGIVITIASFFYAAKIWILAIQNPDVPRTGYNSMMILMLFLGGVIITTLGVIGEYLARIYMEVKNRPIYIERETNIKNGQENKHVDDTCENAQKNEDGDL